MRKITLSLLFIAIVSIQTTLSFAAEFTANLMFSAKLTGAQETPPVATSAIGVASFALNATRDTMCINATVQGLSGTITGAHIHEAAIGVPGPVIIPLTSFVTGNRITATLTGADLTPAMIAKFLDGGYYINVHTNANPGGEIRGQITLETEFQLTASLNGAQETPSVTTSAYGLAVFHLYQNQKALIVDAKFVGLSGPITGAHLHTGATGVPGPVTESLVTGISGNSISIEVDPTLYLADLLSGNMYINVHTTANPNGEIRGQILMDNKFSFDMHLDASQETPPTGVAATGIGYAKLNGAMDTLWVDVVCEGLSSTPTAAHFHNAPTGVPGGVVISLVSDINGSRVSGTVTGSALNATFINNCLTGNIYVNVHTTAFPAGEIRGQVQRYAREGLTYTIDASQETPPTSSVATGSGLASIDLTSSSVHFMMAVDGLTGIINGAHFHNAPPGVPGPVIFPLTSFFSLTGTDDAAFGWWTDDDTTAFTIVTSGLFRTRNAYVNIHTAAFPNGEVRGDILLGGDCFTTFTGIDNPAFSGTNDILIYPNPATQNISLQFTSAFSGEGNLIVTDLTGRTVSMANIYINKGDNKFDVRLDGLDNGIYFATVRENGNLVQTSKIVKQ